MAYPANHPTVVRSLEQVDSVLAQLRGPAGEVILGIADDALVYGTTRIDSAAAQKLAHALYSRNVAVLRLTNETSRSDIEIFLRLLGTTDPGDRRHISELLTEAGVISINLQAVAYTAVHVTSKVEEQQRDERPIWEEVLRALLENQQFSARTREVPKLNAPDEWARMLSESVDFASQDPIFDPNATFGVRLPDSTTNETVLSFIETTIGERIANASGQKRQNSLEQAMQLLHSLANPLRKTILRGVLKVLASDDTGAVQLREFVSELPNDEVLEALRYLSASGKLSSHALMLLQALSGQERARAAPATANVLSEVIRLFGEEDVDRFNPVDHQDLLASVSVRIPNMPAEAFSSMEELGARTQSIESDAIAQQFGEILLDLLEEYGPARNADGVLSRIETLFRASIGAAEFARAQTMLDRLEALAKKSHGAELKKRVEELIGRLAVAETMQPLIDRLQAVPAQDSKHVRSLLERLAALGRKNLIAALADEPNRSKRRRLFNFITSLGPQIVPEVVRFLSDERWYVLRNMVALLRAVQDRSTIPHLQKLVNHPDLRVRMETIKTLFVLDPMSVPQSVLDNLFADADVKLAETAVGLVGTYGIKEAIGPLLRVLEGNDVFGSKRSLRVAAIKALGDIGEPRVLDDLKRFFASTFLPWPSKDERYAAWESLQKYAPDSRGPLITTGLRSSDPQIRKLCSQIKQ